MSLLITIDSLHRFHHYAIQFLPNEIFALLVGAHFDAGDCITNYVHPLILDASPMHVKADWDDVFHKAERYYTVGFVHTHPGRHSSVGQSNADINFHDYMATRFWNHFHRKAYFMIYAPNSGIFALYDGNTPFYDYIVINKQAADSDPLK